MRTTEKKFRHVNFGEIGKTYRGLKLVRESHCSKGVRTLIVESEGNRFQFEWVVPTPEMIKGRKIMEDHRVRMYLSMNGFEVMDALCFDKLVEDDKITVDVTVVNHLPRKKKVTLVRNVQFWNPDKKKKHLLRLAIQNAKRVKNDSGS